MTNNANNKEQFAISELFWLMQAPWKLTKANTRFHFLLIKGNKTIKILSSQKVSQVENHFLPVELELQIKILIPKENDSWMQIYTEHTEIFTFLF